MIIYTNAIINIVSLKSVLLTIKLTVFKYDKRKNSRFVKHEYALKNLLFRLKRFLFN